MSEYKGKWFSVKKESTEILMIVGEKDGEVLTSSIPPKKIPIGELTRDYKREVGVVGSNPYGVPVPGNKLKSQSETDALNKIMEEANAPEPVAAVPTPNQFDLTMPTVVPQVVIEEVVLEAPVITKPPKKLSPQESLVQSAIDVSIANNVSTDAPQSLEVPITISVNFDIDKIVKSCTAMELSVNDIAPILVKNIDIELESIEKHLSEKLAKIIG